MCMILQTCSKVGIAAGIDRTILDDNIPDTLVSLAFLWKPERAHGFIVFDCHLMIQGFKPLFEAFAVFVGGIQTVLEFEFVGLRRGKLRVKEFHPFSRIGDVGGFELPRISYAFPFTNASISDRRTRYVFGKISTRVSRPAFNILHKVGLETPNNSAALPIGNRSGPVATGAGAGRFQPAKMSSISHRCSGVARKTRITHSFGFAAAKSALASGGPLQTLICRPPTFDCSTRARCQPPNRVGGFPSIAPPSRPKS